MTPLPDPNSLDAPRQWIKQHCDKHANVDQDESSPENKADIKEQADAKAEKNDRTIALPHVLVRCHSGNGA
jgi:hypothetical protein